MEPSIYAYIKRHSWRQQLVILGLTLLSFPPLYYSLVMPKQIINDALGKSAPTHLFLGFELSRLHYLLALCTVFLVLVLIGGVLKYVVNVYAGVISERMLRRLRYELYERVLRFPLPHLRRVSQGELVQMINAETEPLGGYVGDALAVPAFQGGTLITTLFFMFMQDPILGFSAIALYPIQAYVIPKLQRQVNNLGKARVRQVRRNAERISETVTGVRDIRANDATQFELARFSEQLGTIYWLRFDIYKKKFLIKFLNNFLAQLGPFFFFTIGGYLVIQGNISLGALVAVVAAHKDLASPWRELLTYYQTMYDVKIKFEQIVVQFDPPGLVPESVGAVEAAAVPALRGTLKIVNLALSDDGATVLDSLNATLELPCHTAIVGAAGSGKEALSLVLAGLVAPQRGRITLGEHDLLELPEAALAHLVAYVGSSPYVFGGTLADNLLYGLKHRPVAPASLSESEAARHARELEEARRAGNSPYELDAQWVDYAAAGLALPDSRLPAMVRALRTARLEDDVYVMGLRGVLHRDHGDLPDRLLAARHAMQARFEEDGDLARLVEPFDPARFNTNATLAENLLFGVPVGWSLDTANLAAHPYILRTLDAVGMVDELRAVGLEVARTMVEIFADLPPDHEYYRQFSFIAPEDLADYQALVARSDADRLDELDAADRERLLSLPFKLISARHRLGLITEEHEARLLKARAYFREHLPAELKGHIAFFEPDEYNQPSSIQDNILFGKIAYGQARAQARVAELITDLLDQLGLKDRVIEVGLDAECGVGGGRLSNAQRQKLAVARAVLKRPQGIVLHDATAALDGQDQVALRDAVLEEFAGRTVIWSLSSPDWADAFDEVLVLEEGRLAGKSNDQETEGRKGDRQREMMPAA